MLYIKYNDLIAQFSLIVLTKTFRSVKSVVDPVCLIEVIIFIVVIQCNILQSYVSFLTSGLMISHILWLSLVNHTTDLLRKDSKTASTGHKGWWKCCVWTHMHTHRVYSWNRDNFTPKSLRDCDSKISCVITFFDIIT